MPGFSGAKKRSLDHPYIVAKLIVSPFAAEKRMVTECPGVIKGDSPDPWNVPDSTSGFEFKTFSTLIVVERFIGPPFSFLQEVIATIADAASTLPNRTLFIILLI